MAGPAELLERQAELGQRPAIQVAAGQEFVARLQQGLEHQELRRVARGGGERGAPAFQARHPLLQHRDGGIVQSVIDVTEVVQVEQRRGVVGVVEHIGRGLVDRRDPRAGGGIGGGAGVHGAGLEAVGDIVRGGRVAARAGRRRRRGRLVADDAGIDPAPGQFAAEAAELDLRAAVHHHLQPRRLGPRAGCVVAHAELHPHDARADGDRVVDDRVHLVGGAEDVDHVDLFGNVAQRGVDALAQQLLAREARVHRNHPVVLALQVFHDEIAWAVPVRRGADQRDRAHGGQDAAQPGIGIRNWIDRGHRAGLMCNAPAPWGCGAVRLA